MIIIYAFLFIFGLVIGSFVNVLIWRIPREEGIVGGRSHCPHCGKMVAWYDLIPLLSFLLLNRRCRHCHQFISWRYFLIELYSGLVFVFSYQFSSGQSLAHWLIVVFLLEIYLALSVIDLEHLILPDKLIIAGLIGVFIYGILERPNIITVDLNVLSLNHLATAGGLFAFFALLWLSSKGQWMGFGDAKLALLIGLSFGFIGGMIVLYTAIIMGFLVGIFLLITAQADLKTKLPFGAFLGVSSSLYLLFGYGIILEQLGSIYTIINIFK